MRVNQTHNMQEVVELYKDVIQFELRDPVGPVVDEQQIVHESSGENLNVQSVSPNTLNGYASAYFGGGSAGKAGGIGMQTAHAREAD